MISALISQDQYNINILSSPTDSQSISISLSCRHSWSTRCLFGATECYCSSVWITSLSLVIVISFLVWIVGFLKYMLQNPQWEPVSPAGLILYTVFIWPLSVMCLWSPFMDILALTYQRWSQVIWLAAETLSVSWDFSSDAWNSLPGSSVWFTSHSACSRRRAGVAYCLTTC